MFSAVGLKDENQKREALTHHWLEVGHLITSVAHLINICRITGRTINWDATEEQIAGDAAANAMLTKEWRSEFSLPTV